MRFGFLRIFANCIVSILLTACADTESAPPPKSAKEFLQALKSVADRSSLADPRETARLLSLSVSEPTEHVTEPNCDYSRASSRDVSRSYKVTSGWYHMQSGGIHQAVPKTSINPAMTTGDPSFSRYYIVTSTKVCKSGGPDKLVIAQLDMEGLPGFACITPAMVMDDMQAKMSNAKDGVSVGTYVSNTGDAISKVRFFFRVGAACALAVMVTRES